LTLSRTCAHLSRADGRLGCSGQERGKGLTATTLFCPWASVLHGSTRPDSMKWKKTSDSTCTARYKRAATSRATVVFPEPGGPVSIKTLPATSPTPHPTDRAREGSRFGGVGFCGEARSARPPPPRTPRRARAGSPRRDRDGHVQTNSLSDQRRSGTSSSSDPTSRSGGGSPELLGRPFRFNHTAVRPAPSAPAMSV
jgi:hypothetical protein